jgi:hypothetical protein
MTCTGTFPANSEDIRRGCVGLYLPENFPDDCLPKPLWEYGAWVVHHLYLQRHLDRRYWDGSFVPLYSKALENILPRHENKSIISALKDANIIQCDNFYRPGTATRRGRSKGYRLRQPYRDAQFRRQLVHHPELAGKLARRREQQERDLAAVHGHLKTMFDGIELTGGFSDDCLPLVMIQNRDYWFTVCEQGRVHTNLTSLKREFRKHVRWNGQSLWMIDIANSQPLILALTVRDGVGGDCPNICLTDAKNPPQPRTNQPPRHQPTRHPPYVRTLSDGGLNDDADRFLDVCVRGELYEALMQLTGMPRDDVKKRFLAVAYGDRSDMLTKVGRAFRELYPADFDAIRSMKLARAPKPRRGERRLKDAAIGELARRMQKLESDLVIGQVCERLRREAPRACLLTIHDCLVTTDEHKDLFERVLREEFIRTYDVEPKFKVSEFANG